MSFAVEITEGEEGRRRGLESWMEGRKMNIVCKSFAMLVGFAVGLGLVRLNAAEDEVPPGKVSTGLMQGPAQTKYLFPVLIILV